MVKVLLENRADVTVASEDGWTLLFFYHGRVVGQFRTHYTLAEPMLQSPASTSLTSFKRKKSWVKRVCWILVCEPHAASNGRRREEWVCLRDVL